MNFLTAVAAEGNRFFFGWEIALMEWLQANLSSGAVSFLSQLSLFGEELMLIVVMGFFYWVYDKEIGKYIGLSFLAANVWGPMIKNVARRLRPYFCSDRIDLLRLVDTGADKYDVAAQGYSFPSGHSAGSATVYGSTARCLKKKWVTFLAFLLPLLVGVSRVVVGAHYPTDVLAGWALGLLAIFLIPWLRKKIKNRWVFMGLIAVTALPGFFYCTSNDYFGGFGMLLGFFLAEPFEERFVIFENTSSILRCVLRTIGGAVIYFGLNEVLKMPFPKEVLEAGNMLAYLIRTLRYAIVIFVLIGVYPMLFKLTGKLWKKKEQER